MNQTNCKYITYIRFIKGRMVTERIYPYGYIGDKVVENLRENYKPKRAIKRLLTTEAVR